jgi:metal-responsive CopG/Arc/MetJ family transcriptional regulator
MRSTITISVPDPMRVELDSLSKSDGVSRSDIVRESLRDYLFVRRFRSMRKSMVSKASARGVYNDQDVFDQVS